jgi:hypothetical protein
MYNYVPFEFDYLVPSLFPIYSSRSHLRSFLHDIQIYCLLGNRRKNDIGGLLGDHVGRHGGEGTRNPGEDRGINNTETRNTPNLEVRVEDGHRVVVSTNGAGG